MPGDDIDLDGLEAQAVARRKACDELMEALSVAWPQDASCPAGLLGQRTANLLSRWEADVLAPLLSASAGATSEGRYEELRQLRGARDQAQQKVDACIERKQAAAAALAAAFGAAEAAEEVEPSEPPDRDDEPVTPPGRRGEGKHHKGRRGWGRKVKGIFGHKKGSSSADPEKESVPLKGNDDPIQCANDELMESAEELQQASEEFDRRNELCAEVAKLLQRNFSDEEASHNSGVREAVREAVLALEEWADDARAVVAGSKGLNGDCGSPGSPTVSTAVGPSRVSPRSTGSSVSDREEDRFQQLTEEELEQLVLRTAEENRALQRALPLRCCAAGHCNTEDAASQRRAWDAIAGSSTGSSAEGEDALARLAGENAELEQALRQRVPHLLAKQLKQSRTDLDRQVSVLEAGTCAWASAAGLHGGGPLAASSASSSRPGTPQPAPRAAGSASSQRSTPRQSPRHAARPELLASRTQTPKGSPRAPSSGSAADAPSPFSGTPRLTMPWRPPELSSVVERSPGMPADGAAAHEQPLPAFGSKAGAPHLSMAALPAAPGGATAAGPIGEDGSVGSTIADTDGHARSEPGDGTPVDGVGGTSSASGRPSRAPGPPLLPLAAMRDAGASPQLDAQALASAADEEQVEAFASSPQEQDGSEAAVGGNPFDDDPSGQEEEEEASMGSASCCSPGGGACGGEASPTLSKALESFAEDGQPADGLPRPTLPSRPPAMALDAAALDEPPPLPPQCGSPRPQRPEDPKQAHDPTRVAPVGDPPPLPPGTLDLSSCLASAVSGAANPGELPMQSAVSDSEVEKAFSTDDLEVALASSDATLYGGRLGGADGYWNWEWRDSETEEQHNELQRCSHSLAEMLTEDDWGLFSYELMLLVHNWLSEDDPALESVRTVLNMSRVSLGINSLLHHHTAELTLPDGSQGYFPLDVRFRAALLLRSWLRAESPCFSLVGLGDGHEGMTAAWIRRQLAVLRGSVLARALALHHEGREAARPAAGACLQALRRLGELAAEGRWGRPQPFDEPLELGGRRLLVALMRNLDTMRPERGHWCLNTVFAAKAFSRLWQAAIDPDTEDHLSLDAPVVAAALLSGLHPHLGNVPLQLETHALLLAQQLWISLSARMSSASAGQLPVKALKTAAGLVEDFTQWLQRSSASTASCFARRGSIEDVFSEEAAELTARRLLTVELRDGLVRALTDYRRHLDPSAFSSALSLWMHSHKETRRSDHLVQVVADRTGQGDQPAGHSQAEDDEFARRMSFWFIWESISSTARLALSAYDEPLQVPRGDADAWRRYGPRIKKHLEGLAGAVQSLLDELECERKYYGEAWEALGWGGDHLGVTAGALSAAVRPRVEMLVESGVWPTRGAAVMEIPAGGGRLLQALETLDRLASRWPEPLLRPTACSLVDMLVPHVCAALQDSFDALDRDITSHALDGSNEVVFQPLKPPALLHCEGVVTLWRFVHDALDAPLNLGVPVDIVVQPFLGYLKAVLWRTGRRLVRPFDDEDAFRLAPRAAQVAARFSSSEYDADSDDDHGGASGGESSLHKRSGGKRRGNRFRWGGEKPGAEEAVRNTVAEAALLEVPREVTAPPVQEVSVRMSSLGFCLVEMGGIYNKLLSAVNSGDDSGVPTVRHNDARRQIFEELPELQDGLQERGHALARYLATRLVYFELRQELFEQLYFVAPAPAAPGTSSSGADTPRSRGTCMTLEEVIARRQDGLLFLVAQTPAPLLVTFVVELGARLTQAWSYVVLDYLGRQKFDDVGPFVDDDQEALKRLLATMMQEVRQRVANDAQGAGQPSLAGLTTEDCDNGQRRLDEVQNLAQMLVLKVQSGSAEELARYAARVRGELADAGLPDASVERARTPVARDRSPAPQQRGRSPFQGRSPSPPVLVESGRFFQHSQSALGAASPRATPSRHSGAEHGHSRPVWKKAMRGVAKRLHGSTSSKSATSSSNN